MSYRLTKRYRFATAHALRSVAFSDAENRDIYGPCANASGHGHDYALELSIEGDSLSEDTLWARGTLDRLVEQHIAPAFEFNDLSDTLGATFISSGENLSVMVYELLAPFLPAHFRLTVRVVETEKNSFVYGPA